jgi:hypothetical protein
VKDGKLSRAIVHTWREETSIGSGDICDERPCSIQLSGDDRGNWRFIRSTTFSTLRVLILEGKRYETFNHTRSQAELTIVLSLPGTGRVRHYAESRVLSVGILQRISGGCLSY